MSDFSNPIFHDETKARKWLESRLWPDGPICPHCGTIDEATLMMASVDLETFSRSATSRADRPCAYAKPLFGAQEREDDQIVLAGQVTQVWAIITLT